MRGTKITHSIPPFPVCNLHDVSWGTKGDNAPDLGSVTVKTAADGSQVVEVEMPLTEDDLDDAYEVFAKQLTKQREDMHTPSAAPATNPQTQQEDGFKEFRTRVVLSWMMSNAILVIFFTNSTIVDKLFPKKSPTSVNPYLTFLFCEYSPSPNV